MKHDEVMEGGDAGNKKLDADNETRGEWERMLTCDGWVRAMSSINFMLLMMIEYRRRET